MCSDKRQRGARYGRHLYEVCVPHRSLNNLSDTMWPDKTYYYADSITVREGTLMLAAEVEEGDYESNEPTIELPPIAIFAPGQWLSVLMVDGATHTAAFSEETISRVLAEMDDDDRDDTRPSRN